MIPIILVLVFLWQSFTSGLGLSYIVSEIKTKKYWTTLSKWKGVKFINQKYIPYKHTWNSDPLELNNLWKKEKLIQDKICLSDAMVLENIS